MRSLFLIGCSAIIAFLGIDIYVRQRSMKLPRVTDIHLFGVPSLTKPDIVVKLYAHDTRRALGTTMLHFPTWEEYGRFTSGQV